MTMADENTNTNANPSDPPTEDQKMEALLKQFPQSIPDKYRRSTPEESVAAFMSAYRELNKSYTQATTELASIKQATPKQETPPADELKIPDAPQENIWTSVEREFAEKKSISEDTVAKLREQGVPVHLIQAALEGLRSKHDQILTEANTLAGGNANDVLLWASKNLSAEEKQAADAGLKNPALWRTTFLGLKARMDAQNPRNGEPSPTPTGAPTIKGGPNIQPYRSQAEIVAAMNDPRYRDPRFKDPAYIAEVEQRCIATYNSPR